MIHLIVDMKPVPKERPRFSRKSNSVYTPNKTARFEAQIKNAAKKICKVPTEKAVEVQIVFNFQKAKSSKLTKHTKRPDIDNLQKGVLDALNKIVFKDDSQIVRLISEKNFSENESVEITVFELN